MHGLRIVLMAGLLACFAGSGVCAAERDQGAEIMAAYVYNFARFVEWPPSAFAAQEKLLVVCTPAEDALDGHLLRVHGREAQGRRVVVRVVVADEDLSVCQVLFLPRQQASRFPAWLAAVAGKPVLTISDAPGFARSGGMIGLYVAANRVHFDINRQSAGDAGLRIGSRLLALAQEAPGGAP